MALYGLSETLRTSISIQSIHGAEYKNRCWRCMFGPQTRECWYPLLYFSCIYVNYMVKTININLLCGRRCGGFFMYQSRRRFSGTHRFERVTNQSSNQIVFWSRNLIRKRLEFGKTKKSQFRPHGNTGLGTYRKKAPFDAVLNFQVAPLIIQPRISILGVYISSDVPFSGLLETKAKLDCKKLGVLNWAGRHIKPNHRLQLYKAQVRLHVEYCFHLCLNAICFLLTVSMTGWIVGSQVLADRLHILAVFRNVASLCVLYG